MLITLAYPYQDHGADETVDLDDATSKALIRDGRARPVEEPEPEPAPPPPTFPRTRAMTPPADAGTDDTEEA